MPRHWKRGVCRRSPIARLAAEAGSSAVARSRRAKKSSSEGLSGAMAAENGGRMAQDAPKPRRVEFFVSNHEPNEIQLIVEPWATELTLPANRTARVEFTGPEEIVHRGTHRAWRPHGLRVGRIDNSRLFTATGRRLRPLRAPSDVFGSPRDPVSDASGAQLGRLREMRKLALGVLCMLSLVGCSTQFRSFSMTLPNVVEPNLPVVFRDATGLVTDVGPATVPDANRQPVLLADPANPTAFVITWMGGGCEQEVAFEFRVEEVGYRLTLASHKGVSCPSLGLPRAIRVVTSTPIPIGSIEVLGRA